MIDEAKLKKRDVQSTPIKTNSTNPPIVIDCHETAYISYYLWTSREHKNIFKHEIYTLLNLFKLVNTIYHEKMSFVFYVQYINVCRWWMSMVPYEIYVWMWLKEEEKKEFDQTDTWTNSCWWWPTDLTTESIDKWHKFKYDTRNKI